MKRCCLSKLPRCIKKMSASPKRGIQISTFLLFTTIVLPVLLVGSDMVSDGGVLGQMWQYSLGKALAGADSGNQAKLNSTAATNSSNWDEEAVNEERNGTGITNSTAEEQEDSGEDLDAAILAIMFLVSLLILIASTLTLLFSNTLATLLRNARTNVMMNSRELERKDVPVPLGNS